MAETRILAPLLERIEQAHGKAVLIGDPHQLPAVGAGGLFAGIVERHGAIELTENRRQHDPDERRALEAIRDGLGRDYLAFAEGQGRLIVRGDAARDEGPPARGLVGSRSGRLPGNVMIALRRRDVAELNALARALMDTHGRLGASASPLAQQRIRAGRSRRLPPQHRRARRQNGTRGTVESVDRERRTLTRAHRPRRQRRADAPTSTPATSATPTR